MYMCSDPGLERGGMWMCGIRVSGEGIWRCGKCENCIEDDNERDIRNLGSFNPISKSDSKSKFTDWPVWKSQLR